MQCYSNNPLRKLFKELSPSSISWSEMEKIDDTYTIHETNPDAYLSQALEKHLGKSEDFTEGGNLVLKFGASDPQRLYSCINHTL